LVISGDIGNVSNESEYEGAFLFVDGIAKQFGVDSSRIIVVPGNHDVNWDKSEESYKFIPVRKLPREVANNKIIPAGDLGCLVRDDSLYQERFAIFNSQFYRRIYQGTEYPLDPREQFVIFEGKEDKLLFLGLNSSWELDHYYKKRSSINIQALASALDRMVGKNYAGWLKIAVWHHPVTGKEMMDDSFLQLLSVHGFQVGMHGHVHEALETFHKYDIDRGMRIIGAGTFGAPSKSQVTGIPLQYNLLTFDRASGTMKVSSRKKEKVNGAWSADARWGAKNSPSACYSFRVPELAY
jgi:3',5'-cyclic AMP phosphodiesterase CpdA